MSKERELIQRFVNSQWVYDDWCLLKAEAEELLAQPEREPLSDEKIMILGVQNLCNEANSFKPFGFARAIEKAHGIGVE